MARSKTKPDSHFNGRWRIISMSAWDEEFIDEEEEGYFEFDQKGAGRVPLRVRSWPDGLPSDHTRWRTCGRMVLGRQRRNGPGAGPWLGDDRREKRSTA